MLVTKGGLSAVEELVNLSQGRDQLDLVHYQGSQGSVPSHVVKLHILSHNPLTMIGSPVTHEN